MTEILLIMTLLGQTIAIPAAPADTGTHKPAEAAPAPGAIPEPVTTPQPGPAAMPAPAQIKPQQSPPPKRLTSEAAFAAAGVTRGLLLLPYWGINSVLDADDYSVGQRLGLFVGWNASPGLAFNAELTMDALDANSLAATSKPSDKLVAIAGSFHARRYASRAMWVFGPSLGYFTRDRWTYDTSPRHASSRGFTLGLMVGAFIPVGPVALGGLASIRHYKPTRTCETSSTNRAKTCNGWDDDGENAAKLVAGLAGAVLF
jgi:hypothetical protein